VTNPLQDRALRHPPREAKVNLWMPLRNFCCVSATYLIVLVVFLALGRLWHTEAKAKTGIGRLQAVRHYAQWAL
jgi:hypothetical protein